MSTSNIQIENSLPVDQEKVSRNHFEAAAPLQTAVLFLVFNRPEPTAEVFEAIRKAKPPRLYIAADGPRKDHEGEAEKVAAVRELVSRVDWPCEVTTLFRDENMGCRKAVSSAITWFFEHEEQGIILEDDCLPAQSFFLFCQEMLNRYRDDNRIWQISGTTFFSEDVTSGNADYFFSRYGPIWGWASWRRAWKFYDVDLELWPEMRKPEFMEMVYSNPFERAAKLSLGERLYRNSYDTWDFQWGFAKAFNNALTVLPRRNQIVNIGFGPDATHTTGTGHMGPKRMHELVGEISHPLFVLTDRMYDDAYANNVYQRRNRWVHFVDRIKQLVRRGSPC